MPPILPTELLFEIYSGLFPSIPRVYDEFDFSPMEKDFEKPRWQDIKSLTLVSKQSRMIALSLWFHTIRINDEEIWKDGYWETCSLAYKYARIIHYTSRGYQTPARFLSKFTRFHTLRIDFPPTHLTSYGTDSDIAAPQLEQIFHETIPLQTSLNENENVQQSLPRITHLVIHGITWLEPLAMKHLSRFFPNLRSLTLKQPFIWCGACNTIGNPDFLDFLSAPRKYKAIELVYNNSGCRGLPSSYVKNIFPLKHLHTIKFSVACGVGLPWYEDLFQTSRPSHEPNSRTNLTTSSTSTPTPHSPSLVLRSYEFQDPPNLHLVTDLPPTQKDDTLRLFGWSGECQSCLVQLALDPGFRRTWNERRETFYKSVSEKTGVLPSLRKVEWELLELTHINWPMLL